MSQNNDWRDIALEMAWVIIANSNGGNWKDEPAGWEKAACKWRDEYFGHINDERTKRDSRFPRLLNKRTRLFGSILNK